MNLRLSPNNIRFRVTQDEFEQLLSGRAVSMELALPRDHIYRASVRPSVLGKWQLEKDPTGLWLTVPAGDLNMFSESLPSRQGLEHAFELSNGGVINVTLEVDVKDRKRLAVSG